MNNMRRSISSLIKFSIAILPTICIFYALVQLFPYTGLERILALPSIIFVNSIIIMVGLIKSRNVNRLRSTLIWVAIVLLSITITIALYPQESRPHVFRQIGYGISAIENFDNTTPADLELQNASRSNSAVIKNAEERYVVALFKYRKQIPLDGSYNIYENENDYFFDTTITSLDEIPRKLIGYHKVIWWYLETFNY